MPKIIQIASLSGEDPEIVALTEDGSIFVYRPRVTLNGVTIDEGGWLKIPPIPEND